MSDLEDQLAFQLRAAKIPFGREYKAIIGRRFKWDFMVPGVNGGFLIEVQGGIWTKGGHSTGKGITRDCEKLNLATLSGFRCLAVTKEHIESGQALMWIQQALTQTP